MDILLRQVRIIDPSSTFHQQTTDILISNGFIKSIGRSDSSVVKDIRIPGLCVSPGWVDCFAHFCDPGFEFKETIETGASAAANGGYTDVMILPNTQPVLHNKSGVEYIVQRSRALAVQVHPIGAVTKNAEGKELAEMYDMHASGAVAFSDGVKTIQSSGVVLKALQYLKAIDRVLIQLPDDHSLSTSGLMNESVLSTRLGLPGRPEIAEELMVRRDIELARYAGSKIHITGLSTSNSIELVRQAKKDGINVTASVTPYHLFFTEQDLHEYNTNLKVNPPLRSEEDQKALRQGLLDGTIDCVATHHIPHDTDNKIVEFEYAKFGMTGLETAFAVVKTSVPEISDERLVEIFSSSPRKIFGLEQASIKEGSRASLSLFLPDVEWEYSRSASKSKNSPFLGRKLKGRPLGIINKEQVLLNQ